MELAFGCVCEGSDATSGVDDFDHPIKGVVLVPGFPTQRISYGSCATNGVCESRRDATQRIGHPNHVRTAVFKYRRVLQASMMLVSLPCAL